MTALDRPVRFAARTTLPTRHGRFDLCAVEVATEPAHVLLGLGLGEAASEPLPVRLHSECLTGDALGSHRCDCGDQLDAALAWIARNGRGAVVYLRGHEGRGIGIVDKLRAYALQDDGLDTVDANIELGRAVEERDYASAALILSELGVERVRLLTSNPAKQEALESCGIEVVERVHLDVPDRPENRAYRVTKRIRMGHDAPDHPAAPPVGDLYAPIRRDVVTFAQMGQSVDGFIATSTRDGAGLTSRADHVHLHRLRSGADAVIVGASTVVADDCRLTVRLVQGRDPVRVVLDPRARLPRAARVLTDGAAPTLWVVGDDAVAKTPAAPHVTVARLPLADGRFEPATIVQALHERGLRRLLVEGGGTTVSAFLAAGTLDHLYLTVSPVFLGGGVRGLRVPPTERVAAAFRPRVSTHALGDDTCLSFELSPAGTASGGCSGGPGPDAADREQVGVLDDDA